jgi:hypothetical protein
MTNKTTSAIDLLAPCPKCHFQDQRPLGAEASCHHTAHTCSGSGEFVVICPRCKHSGPLKARPEWAVEAWNEQTKPSAIDLVERLRNYAHVASMLGHKLDDPNNVVVLATEAADTITRLRAALKPLADSVLPEKDTISGWRCGTNIPPSAAYHAHELLYGPNPHARSVGGE